jgi:large subunit ribosomal protein L7Ae
MADKKELALQAIEVARTSGKIRKGTNEATKALEKGIAKLVVYAKDVQPAEIVMHLPILAKEKNVPCVQVDSREELGAAAGVNVPAASVVIVQEGEAKKIIAQITKE